MDLLTAEAGRGKLPLDDGQQERKYSRYGGGISSRLPASRESQYQRWRLVSFKSFEGTVSRLRFYLFTGKKMSQPTISCESIPSVPSAFEVRLFNRSEKIEANDISLSVSLTAREKSYWAPFNVIGTSAPMNSKDLLSLQPGEVKLVRLHLEKLLWAKTISSVWPRQSFYEAVPKGQYEVSIEIKGKTPEGARWKAVGVCSHSMDIKPPL